MIRGVWLSALCIAAIGCGQAKPPDTSDVDGGGDVSCLTRTDLDAYSPNMVKVSSSGHVKVTLVSSDPNPPARGTNTWSVTMTDENGAPIAGASPTAVPFMPEHGHGSSVTPDMTSSGGPDYSVTPLYFFMPGIWQTTVSPAPDSVPADQVKFSFCISG